MTFASIFAYFDLYCRFSLAAGVLLALVCFLDWLCGLVKKYVKEKDNV